MWLVLSYMGDVNERGPDLAFRETARRYRRPHIGNEQEKLIFSKKVFSAVENR
jgi:hypothetical protein